MSARLAAALRREAEEVRRRATGPLCATVRDDLLAHRDRLLDRADAVESDRPQAVAA